MRTLANSEDPDEVLNGVYTIWSDKTDLQRKKYSYYLEIITCNPWIYTMGHPKLILSNQKEESISA